MRYESVRQISREEYEQMIQSNDPAKIASALLSVSYWERDWRWTQDQLLSFIDHEDYWVRRNATQGLGYVARVNGELDTALVEPILKEIATAPSNGASESVENMHLRVVAEDALEDIDIFIHRRANTGKQAQLGAKN